MLEQFEFLLDELLHPSRFPAGVLAEAARYAVLGGGKRLRPQLLMHVATLSGSPLQPALVPACAIEMIHAFSLVHDDLPCMDDDDVRRGRPSLHRVVTEAQALLTGDFLLAYPFEIISTAPHLSAEQKLEIIQTVSHRVGAWGMIGGQELDIRWSQEPPSENNLRDLHRRKTGSLIQASVECGLIINPLTEAPLIKKLGVLLGDLYQLLDDLQDTQDIIEGRPNALSLWGAEKAQAMAERLYEEICDISHPWHNSSFNQLISLWDPLKG